MASSRLFSPLNIFILLVILVFAVAIALLTVAQGAGQFLFGRAYAEGELKSYVAEVLKETVGGASCQAIDSDRNGYVSCDYTTARESGVTRSVECAAWGVSGFINRGCKTRLPMFPNGQG